MRTMMFLLLAASLPAAIWAQNAKAAAPNATPQMKAGANLCGHAMDAGTFVDVRVRNASGQEALVMRWLDAKGTAVHSALFMGRCVAKDGDTIDGKLISRVLPSSLALSNRHALTAWESEYWNYPGEQTGGHTPHRGAFIDSRFVTELDASKASEAGGASSADSDFRWNEEQESLTLKPGIVLVPAPLNYTYRDAPPPSAQVSPAKTPAPPCPVVPKQGFFDRLKRHAEQALEKQAGKADAQIDKGSQGNVDIGVQDSTTTAINQANQQNPCAPAKGQGAKQ